MSDNEPTTEAAKRSVSYATLVLAIVITAIVTAGSVLAVVYLPGDGELLEQEDEHLLEQEGRFSRHGVGSEGQIFFPHPYSSPPNVKLIYPDGSNLSDTPVVEVTATGFKWKHSGNSMIVRNVIWKAKGVKATLVPK